VAAEALGRNICDNILFLHAILGCDTTSRFFSLGKGLALKKAKSSQYFLDQTAVFRRPNAMMTDIVIAGENDIVSLQIFCRKVSTSTACVQPRSLPPTSASAKYHSLRVYQQVQQWLGNDLPPEDWGWTIKDNKMIPVPTDMKPAPAYLLEAIRCNCKSGCETQRCGCRKFGLDCSLACGECKGMHCSNVIKPIIDSDSDTE